ncbi:MAG: hypothetical protein L6R00_02675 [Phycisphaerae bacterium]|nr:hypothetical protein [Phycisphaerae bacterium]
MARTRKVSGRRIVLASVLFGAVLGAAPFWGIAWLTPVAFGLIFGALGFIISFVGITWPIQLANIETQLSTIRNSLRDLRNEIGKLQTNLERTISGLRDDALLKCAPLALPAENFLDALEAVEKRKFSHAWLLAKFIACKLGGDFHSVLHGCLTYKEPFGLSRLLGVLIPECRERVVFTFPYTPREWVKQVYPTRCVHDCHGIRPNDCPIVRDILDGTLALPDHIKQVMRWRAAAPLRLVTRQWPADDTCYLHVLALCSEASGVETLFVRKEMHAAEGDPIDENVLDDVLVSCDRNLRCTLQMDAAEAKRRVDEMKRDPATPPQAWKDAMAWAKGTWVS